MQLEVALNNLAARALALTLAIILCSLLAVLALSNFIKFTLADERLPASRELLSSALDYFPNSPRLHARIAEAEMAATDRDLDRAASHARQAAELSPYDFNLRLTLATIQELRGESAAAERSLRRAVELAPHSTEVRWRLANLLVRQGRLAESLAQFQAVAGSDGSLLPASLDLAWQASGGDLGAVEQIAGAQPKARLALAQFLLKQSRTAEAVSVFSRVERSARAASPQSPAFINTLVAAGHVSLAREAWSHTVSDGAADEAMWNGGFESDILKDFSQFDWQLSPSDYARISIDASSSRTGARSLRIDFLGRDTTKLDGEIKQLVVVQPGARYRLECFAKTDRLATPEGPRLAVRNAAGIALAGAVAVSAPVASGSNDWKPVTVDFIAPQSASSVYVTIERKPRFSYDAPTEGTLWLDDFVLRRQ